MHLTSHTDYALRLLIYLAVRPDVIVPIEEVSSAYGISRHHLLKIQNRLAALGYLSATRGRRGGVKLAMAPDEIRIGDVVRHMEPDLNLVECFDAATDTCIITPHCGLKSVLKKAQTNFLETLDEVSLSDVIRRRSGLESTLVARAGARAKDERR